MNSIIKCNIFKFVCDLRVQVPQVRLYEKKAYVRRFGYTDKILTKGLLPRHKDFKPVKEMPAYEPKNAWAEKRALFGQNDYIDILGDGNIHPTRLLTHVPYYLRGIRGNEYKIAIRRMKVFGENWSHMRPQKYVDFAKRMKYLHGYFNSLQNR